MYEFIVWIQEIHQERKSTRFVCSRKGAGRNTRTQNEGSNRRSDKIVSSPINLIRNFSRKLLEWPTEGGRGQTHSRDWRKN